MNKNEEKQRSFVPLIELKDISSLTKTHCNMLNNDQKFPEDDGIYYANCGHYLTSFSRVRREMKCSSELKDNGGYINTKNTSLFFLSKTAFVVNNFVSWLYRGVFMPF